MAIAMSPPPALFRDFFTRKIIFVSGKGGVGKTTLSETLAMALAKKGRKVLWVTIEDPLLKPGEVLKRSEGFTQLNANADIAFDEYVGLKIPIPALARIFFQNKLVKYLSRAAPGIHELVLAGKIWWEREHYDHVIVDMLSTGYGLAMFQSTTNFAHLFRGSPLQKDATAMMATFSDPKQTGHLIVALPEEMPLQEGIELDQFLRSHFPENPAAFLVNRCFPTTLAEIKNQTPTATSAELDAYPPLTTSTAEFATRRGRLENFNLRLWRDLGITFESVPYFLDSSNFKSNLAEWFAV